MYIPGYSKKTDLERLHAFIQHFSFATLITPGEDGVPRVFHAPVLLKDPNTLIGHLARANPHWKDLENSKTTICVIQGPNGYMSPVWYKDPMNVPTWNYTAVQIQGKATVKHDSESIEKTLKMQVEHHESQLGTGWQYDLPGEFNSRLVSALVGFEIEISSIEGKFKLSQNRKDEDWISAIQGVEKFYGKTNPEFVALMKEEFESR